MPDSDPHDDTSADYEQLETELLAQDLDAASVATADVDDATAHRLVNDLIDADVVTPVPGIASSFTSRVTLPSTRRRSWPSSTVAGQPAAAPTRGPSDAADAHGVRVLRRAARYRSWRGAYLGRRRTGHPFHLRRLRDPDGTRSRRARSLRLRRLWARRRRARGVAGALRRLLAGPPVPSS